MDDRIVYLVGIILMGVLAMWLIACPLDHAVKEVACMRHGYDDAKGSYCIKDGREIAEVTCGWVDSESCVITKSCCCEG